ncbi:MAG: cadherin-like beta sandwich domain-containing protein, partial [Gammaproteobacteria bacterium]
MNMPINMNCHGDNCRARRFVLPAILLTMVFTLLAAAPASAAVPGVPHSVLQYGLNEGSYSQWFTPKDDGGKPITHYLHRRWLVDCNQFANPGNVFASCWFHPGQSPEGLNAGIANGITWFEGTPKGGGVVRFQARACNADGCGDWTPPHSVIISSPALPRIQSAIGVEEGIALRWTKWSHGREVAPDGWSVRWRRPDLNEAWQTPNAANNAERAKNINDPAAREYTIRGLAGGATYEVQMAAFNKWGFSHWVPLPWQPAQIAVAGSSDTALSSLSMSRPVATVRIIPFAQTFAPDTLTYSAGAIPFFNPTIKLEMRPRYAGATIAITRADGDFALSADADGNFAHTAPLAEGINQFDITVTAAYGGHTRTYSVTVSRTHATLSALQIAAGRVNEVLLSPTNLTAGDNLPFRPAFAPDVRTYDVSVSHHVAELRLRLAAGKLVRSIAYFNPKNQFLIAQYPQVYAQLADIQDARIAGFAIAEGASEIQITLTDIDGGEEQYLIRANRARQLFLPDMPLLVTAVPGDAQIDVAWRAPGIRHGANELPLGGYRLRWRYVQAQDTPAQVYGKWESAAGDQPQGELLAADATAYRIAGRLYFLPHEVQLAAVNADGIGAWVTVKTTAVKVPAPDVAYALTTHNGAAHLRVQLPPHSRYTSRGFVNFRPATVEDFGMQIKSADADWPIETLLSGEIALPPGVSNISTDEELAKGIFRFRGFAPGRLYDVRAF